MFGIGMGYGFFSREFMVLEVLVCFWQFWLVADVELIVYGVIEFDVMVIIGGCLIKFNEDGIFCF